ncbi:MAG: glutamine--tRNA ligase/YqeY domain fusion protein [Spirochaetales bacterium]|nr:glutamine--tRNA ligase/YqeY domain fusion protein [Spirochaetales bacterium]MCF7938660.1 glutamine--tRNA ligase/YqeY domain fusion protein [Spirochaetales bacterium]
MSEENTENKQADREQKDFIRQIIDRHNESGRFGGRVHTRFPPEPNGYLHIGHAKSIVLNFTIAEDYGGKTNLRFDDTNPTKEEQEYVDSIIEDVHWLGFDWEDRLFFASDYFERMYEYALQLIRQGDAYVDSQSAEEISRNRRGPTESGVVSPYRERSVEENLDLFKRMAAGEFADGECVLRAKIDMNSPNLNMRDPVMYRILHKSHHRTGDTWCIYPMYDWAHGLEDSIEGITHSICTLEFENHRPLYDWFLDRLGAYHPQQIEFARLNLSYTVMSKRLLMQLVQENYVDGWDDPRMPTISGMRRRGYTPEAIRAFAERVGVSKTNSMVALALLEHMLREDLNKRAIRVMVVLDPVRLVIENYPEGEVEWFEGENNPEDPEAGGRKIPFSRELYIEAADFMEDPPKKFFRLAPGREVRLKHAYYVTCTGVERDAEGNITEIRATYDPATRGGWSEDGRKVKGTLHWVSAAHAADVQVNHYSTLFTREDLSDLDEGESFFDYLNPESKTVLTGCKAEPWLAETAGGAAGAEAGGAPSTGAEAGAAGGAEAQAVGASSTGAGAGAAARRGSSVYESDSPANIRYQFLRKGYYVLDQPVRGGIGSGRSDDKGKRTLVFNQTVTLRDTWAKIAKKQKG